MIYRNVYPNGLVLGSYSSLKAAKLAAKASKASFGTRLGVLAISETMAWFMDLEELKEKE